MGKHDLRDWIVRTYDSDDRILHMWRIDGRTESQADKEAGSDSRVGEAVDWSMTAVHREYKEQEESDNGNTTKLRKLPVVAGLPIRNINIYIPKADVLKKCGSFDGFAEQFHACIGNWGSNHVVVSCDLNLVARAIEEAFPTSTRKGYDALKQGAK